MSNFEQAALEKLLAGEHPILAGLRVQAEEARVASRELTGSGFRLELADTLDAWADHDAARGLREASREKVLRAREIRRSLELD